MPFRVNAPAQDAGYAYSSDWPTAGGVPGRTPVNQFRTASKGGFTVAGLSSQVAPGAAGTFHPTIAWMLGFVVVEMVVFQLLSRFLNL